MMRLAATCVSCSLHFIKGRHKMAEEARTSGQSVHVGQPLQGELIPLVVVLLRSVPATNNYHTSVPLWSVHAFHNAGKPL
jgi:hypothetical protein